MENAPIGDVTISYVISGSFELTLERDGISETHHFEEGDLFAIDPFVKHSFRYSEETVLVSMYDRGVELENGEKDIFSE